MLLLPFIARYVVVCKCVVLLSYASSCLIISFFAILAARLCINAVRVKKKAGTVYLSIKLFLSLCLFSGYSLSHLRGSGGGDSGAGADPAFAEGGRLRRQQHPVVSGCQVRLVESIPEGLVYNSSVQHMRTYEVSQ